MAPCRLVRSFLSPVCSGYVCCFLFQPLTLSYLSRWHGDPATTRPIQGRTSGVGNNMAGGQVGGDEGEDEEPMLDFNDPSTLNHLNGMSHDRQHVYINPQNLPNNIPNPIPNTIPNPIPNQPIPPPPASTGLRPPGQMPPPPVHEMPAMNIPITQDMIARGLHLLSLQTQVAQEKLEYMRRREARELSEFTQRKEVVDKVNMARHKSERAIVCYLLPMILLHPCWISFVRIFRNY